MSLLDDPELSGEIDARFQLAERLVRAAAEVPCDDPPELLTQKTLDRLRAGLVVGPEPAVEGTVLNAAVG